MYRSVLLSVVLLLVLCIAAPPSSYGNTDDEYNGVSLEKRFQIAKMDYLQLENVSSIGNSRDNWIQCTNNFHKIYHSAPQSDFAPKSLFMLGKLYQRMFQRFHQDADLKQSINNYNEVFRLFPNNSLADDSLLAVANIYWEDLHDSQKAADLLRKIVSDFPNGDMHVQASRELQAISQGKKAIVCDRRSETSPNSHLINVLPVKYWSSDNYTRIVIDASGPVTYKDQLLERVGDQPRRLYIDFYNSYIEPRYRSPVPIEDGLLKRIRTGQYSKDTVRVVLDIESISSFKVFSLPDPFRVVVDVRGQKNEVDVTSQPSEPVAPAVTVSQPEEESDKKIVDSQPVTASSTSQTQHASIKSDSSNTDIVILQDKKKVAVNAGHTKEEPSVRLPKNSKNISLAQQLGLRVKTIVLDPGHGGKDPGAMAFNMKEKDIVLRVAKKLAPILEKRLGCRVILTRTKDVFIPLEERTAIANKNDADLFISLHINASQSESAYGIETYFLNLTTNPEAMRVAAYENATSTHQMSELQNILSDILKNSKVNESSRLAQQVHNSIINGLEKDYSNIKSLGVKQAPFYVLIGAEMPAILIEMSFISNPGDAQHLKNDRFLDRIANDISSGIQSYINTNTASLY